MGKRSENSGRKSKLANVAAILISLGALGVSIISLDQSRNGNEIARQSNVIAEDSKEVAQQALDAAVVNVEAFGFSYIAEDPEMSAPSDKSYLDRRGTSALWVPSELRSDALEGTGEDTEQLYAFAFLENLGPSRMLELELTDIQCNSTGNEPIDGWLPSNWDIGLLKPFQAIALLVHVVEGKDRSAAYESLPCSEILITFTYINIFNESHEGSVNIDMINTVEMFDRP